MGRGCEITKHLRIAHRHLLYYSDVLMLVCLFERKWLDDGFMKDFFLRFCRYGIEGWE
jgi:hypothetical protein